MILTCYDKAPSTEAVLKERILVIFNKLNRFQCVRRELTNNRKLLQFQEQSRLTWEYMMDRVALS